MSSMKHTQDAPEDDHTFEYIDTDETEEGMYEELFKCECGKWKYIIRQGDAWITYSD